MQLEEQQQLVLWLEVALERQHLELDRQLTLQQKKHEQNIQLLLQHIQEHVEERQATSRLQFQGMIQALEKELAHSMWVNQELNQKLSTSHLGGQGRGMERNVAGDRPASLRMQENFSTYGMLEQTVEKSRDLVHAPLPSTWRRSSQSTANMLIPDDLHQKNVEFLLQAGQAE
ncbi:UNVERIFIED_CONTAM: hypothetical protein K2H54_033857 [Gekko kuhli]